MEDMGNLLSRNSTGTYLGIDILKTKHGIKITQARYIQSILKRFNMQDCKPVATPLDPSIQLAPLTNSNTAENTTENNNENTDAEVPWASTLPFVGPLFKQQRKALQKSELVILMRPQVVSDDVWLNEIKRTAETFKELR